MTEEEFVKSLGINSLLLEASEYERKEYVK